MQDKKLFKYIDEQQVMDKMSNADLESMCSAFDYEFISSRKKDLTLKELAELGKIV